MGRRVVVTGEARCNPWSQIVQITFSLRRMLETAGFQKEPGAGVLEQLNFIRSDPTLCFPPDKGGLRGVLRYSNT